MKERIKELAKQAGCSIDGMGFGEGDVEGLAELIVQECARVLEQQAAVSKNDRESYLYGASLIEEHFGVE